MPYTCKLCNNEITNPEMQCGWYQEDFPEIIIGPYCEDCVIKIKICSGCQHPFHNNGNDIKHYGEGRWYCGDCASNLEICGSCDKEASIHATVNGVKYCSTCYSKKFFKCGCCGEDHLKETNHISDLKRAEYAGLFKKYVNVCLSCFEEKKSRFKKYEVSKCAHCSGIYAKKKGSHPRYCDSCYASFPQCIDCGTRHPNLQSYRIDVNDDSFKVLCGKCKKSYTSCASCKSLTKKPRYIRGLEGQQVALCQRDGCKRENIGQCTSCRTVAPLRDGYCEQCTRTYKNNTCFDCGRVKDMNGECRHCRSSEIYCYSTRPQLVFHSTAMDKKKGDSFFFGIENEMTFGSSSSKQNTALNHIYKEYDPTILLAKSDGSINGRGFEVVTQPMTMRFFHQLNLTHLFENKPKLDSSCGLHIHVSRDAFISDMHIFKASKIIQDFGEYTDKIAGRSAGSYNANFGKKLSKVFKDAKKGNTPGRHSRVNLTREDTVEFRLFAGCVDEYTLRYRVEWLNALVTWSKGVALKDVTPENLNTYILKNKKMYPTISRYLSA